MAGKQPLKKKDVKSSTFNVNELKYKMLGGEQQSKVADKPMEWLLLPPAFQEAVKLPGIPMGRVTMVRGWSDTGKSTIKNLAIAAAMRQGYLPVIFETESNFDFQYAKDCGMAIEPEYGTIVNEETGEESEGIVNWSGDYFLFTPSKMCDFCGDMDYTKGSKVSTKRRVAVIEDIAYIMNTFMDMQDNGELPKPLFFVWDSVGSICSWKSYTSKTGNNMFDANALSTAFKNVFPRIGSSKEVGAPYTNGFFIVNKIWVDSQNSMGGAVSVENSGGKTFQYAMRLGLHLGGTAKAAIKKLKATYKGEEYHYGTLTKISVFKNQLPTPYNITYSGTMCCVHNGIISESELDTYKKQEIPGILTKKLEEQGKSIDDFDASLVSFSEEEENGK